MFHVFHGLWCWASWLQLGLKVLKSQKSIQNRGLWILGLDSSAVAAVGSGGKFKMSVVVWFWTLRPLGHQVQNHRPTFRNSYISVDSKLKIRQRLLCTLVCARIQQSISSLYGVRKLCLSILYNYQQPHYFLSKILFQKLVLSNRICHQTSSSIKIHHLLLPKFIIWNLLSPSKFITGPSGFS